MGYCPSVVDCSCEVSSLLATLSDRKPTPSWDLHRVKMLHGMSTCSRMGSSMDCSADICSSVDLHVTAGETLLQQLEHLIPLILL